ncbi:PIN domain-containing protein [Enorma massiliensis]|uniref:PIN domain-containing protein n=1 Tax=Enorma massiliensis TaxID=1472761 RepID=UPI0034A57F21
MKFVVDANVVVSGALRPASKPGRILDLMLAREFSYAGWTELVEEYLEVLKRPQVRI